MTEPDHSNATPNTPPIARWLKENSAIVSLLPTFLLASFAGLQVRINGSISDTSQASNRAFVFFEEAGLVPYPPVGDLKVYAVIAKISNSGNTYGRNLKIRFDCPRRDADLPRVADPFTLGRWAGNFDPPAMLGPKQSAPVIACEFTPDEIAKARANTTDLFFLAEVRYDDAFDGPRVTQMTRKLLTDTSGGLRLGFTGRNCADDDCPKPSRSGARKR
jgi:hypothetical protein